MIRKLLSVGLLVLLGGCSVSEDRTEVFESSGFESRQVNINSKLQSNYVCLHYGNPKKDKVSVIRYLDRLKFSVESRVDIEEIRLEGKGYSFCLFDSRLWHQQTRIIDGQTGYEWARELVVKSATGEKRYVVQNPSTLPDKF